MVRRGRSKGRQSSASGKCFSRGRCGVGGCLSVTLKHAQRRLFDVLLSDRRVALLVLLSCATVVWIVGGAGGGGPAGTLRGHSHACSYTDNIAERAYTRGCIEPIDIVYTWVNGSDPIWRAQKEKYLQRYLCEVMDVGCHDNGTATSSFSGAAPWSTTTTTHVNATGEAAQTNATVDATTNKTATPTLSTPSPSPSSSEEDIGVGTDNRYQDNEELRYSLRSLFRFAPWVRRIYIVTANQVPYWLDISHPRLFMVNHEDIFPDASHLPSFSSPAIESNIHRIPGLSRRFIYFNDDVMLGAPTHPEDFHSPSTGQKVYLSWEVPKCNQGCADSWIGDGQCDLACNVSRCLWDLNDCENTTTSTSGGSSGRGSRWGRAGNSHSARTGSYYCASGCSFTWVGDKVCDNKCENVECGWDGGDCGMSLIWGDEEHEGLWGMGVFPPMPAANVGTGVGFDHSPYLEFSKSSSDDNVTAALLRHHENHSTAAALVLPPALRADSHGLSHTVSRYKPARTTSLLAGPVPGDDGSYGQPRSLYWIPAGNPSVYVNLSAICPSVPEDLCEVTAASHNRPDVLGNALVLQVHKVLILLFHIGDEAEKLGRAVTNVRVTGKKKVSHNVTMANGSVITNITWTIIETEFDLSSNAAGDPSVDKMPEPVPDIILRGKVPDRVVIQAGNATIANVAGDEIVNVTEYFHANRSSAKVVDEDEKNNLDDSVVLPADRSAGVVRLKNSSSASAIFEEYRDNLNQRRRRQLLSSREPSSLTQGLFAPSIATSLSPARLRRRHGRHLLDIYGESLVNVNMMYHRRFGKDSRKVPAHMPHMIDTNVMKELWNEYPKEFNATSGRRFRGGEDMQFSFAHFYWLIHRVPELDLKSVYDRDLDADGDGRLSDNELRSLAAIVQGKAPSDEQIAELRTCLRPPVIKTSKEETEDGMVYVQRTVVPHATFKRFLECSKAVRGVKEHWRRPPTHTIMNLEEVTFEMVGSDWNKTRDQLDALRARPTKFVCLNDDGITPSVQRLLKDYYDSMFAIPSPFELLPGERNPSLYTDEMRAILRRQKN